MLFAVWKLWDVMWFGIQNKTPPVAILRWWRPITGYLDHEREPRQLSKNEIMHVCMLLHAIKIKYHTTTITYICGKQTDHHHALTNHITFIDWHATPGEFGIRGGIKRVCHYLVSWYNNVPRRSKRRTNEYFIKTYLLL